VRFVSMVTMRLAVPLKEGVKVMMIVKRSRLNADLDTPFRADKMGNLG
jgi:hypothetical protein